MFIRAVKNHFEKLKKAKQESGFILLTLAVIGLAAGAYAYFKGGAALWNLAGGVITALLDFINGFTFQILALSGNFLNYVLSSGFTGQSLTSDPNFNNMWSNVRDLTNMLIVLGFVFVGIATILRMRDYEAKKLLPKLILVAILLNFSGLLCTTIYSTANTVQNAFLGNGGSQAVSSMVANLDQSVNENEQNASATQGVDSQQAGSALVSAIGSFIFILFGSVVFFMLAILLTVRYGILVVFYIISPLAMFCFVFPQTSKFWNQWWEQFIRWSFLGTIAGFLIYLAASTLPANAASASVSQYCVSFVFLYIAYDFSKKGSAIGSAAIMGGAAAVAAYATGGVSMLAKGAGKDLANSRAGQAAQVGATKLAEKVPIIGAPKGSAARLQDQFNQSSGSADRSKFWTSEQRQKLATGRAMTRTQRNDKIQAINDMASKGELSSLPAKQRDAALSYAQSRGSTSALRDSAKFDPNLAIPKAGQSKAEAVQQSVNRMSARDLVQNLHPSAYTPEVVGAMDQKQVSYLYDRGSKSSIDGFDDGLKKYLANTDKTDPLAAQAVRQRVMTAQAAGKTEQSGGGHGGGGGASANIPRAQQAATPVDTLAEKHAAANYGGASQQRSIPKREKLPDIKPS